MTLFGEKDEDRDVRRGFCYVDEGDSEIIENNNDEVRGFCYVSKD